MWHSVISTPGAWFMTGDADNFYLKKSPEKFQYIKISIELIPQEFTDLYHLQDEVKSGFVYREIMHGMYGLIEVDVLAEKTPQKHALKNMTLLK